MTLAGKGILAIWNDIAPEAEADFLAWHVNEHIPERIGVPGFLKGRRYRGEKCHPKYFNFYETETWETLTSPAYLERLNSPSPWTKQVVQHFKNTSRTMCTIAASMGTGDGSSIATFRLKTDKTRSEFIDGMTCSIMEPVLRLPEIVGIHLLEGQKSPNDGPTAEKALRGQPDTIADWILLVESVDEKILHKLLSGLLSPAQLKMAGASLDNELDCGIYNLQYALTRSQLPDAGHKSGK